MDTGRLNESERCRLIGLFYACGQCCWYDKGNKKCPRCFPNKVVESTDDACSFFTKTKGRRFFFNVPRKTLGDKESMKGV